MANTCSQPTYHLVQGRGSAFSVVSVLWLIKMAALVIHAAALELTKEVKEAVFIGGVTAQLLRERRGEVHYVYTETPDCVEPLLDNPTSVQYSLS